jgi:hypothetical protein
MMRATLLLTPEGFWLANKQAPVLLNLTAIGSFPARTKNKSARTKNKNFKVGGRQ